MRTLRDLASIVGSFTVWGWTALMHPRFCHVCNRPLWRWERHDHHPDRETYNLLTRAVEAYYDHRRPHP